MTSFTYERVVWSGRKRAPCGALLATAAPPPPRRGCIVCGRARLGLAIDTRRTTLAQLLDRVVRKRLAVSTPYLIAGGFMYEEGGGMEPDEVEDNARHLPVALAALPGGGLGHGVVLEVRDAVQDFMVELVIEHRVRHALGGMLCCAFPSVF